MPIQILPKHVQESLVGLYLRLNGYFSSGHILHANLDDLAIRERGDIDVFAIRLPYSREPETGVPPSPYLGLESAILDIIVGEVKSGRERIQFNRSIREPSTLFRVLRRAGFSSHDDKLLEIAKNLTDQMQTHVINNPEHRIEIHLQPTPEIPLHVRIRPVIFHLGRKHPDRNQAWFVGYEEIMTDIWKRLRQEFQPDSCQREYDYHLWGPVVDAIVDYFKSENRNAPGTPEELVRELMR